MTKERTKELLADAQNRTAVMQAYIDGKQIQFYDDTNKVWKDIFDPDWFPGTFYRIKPQLKYRSFKNAEECWQEMLKHQPFGWIKCKEGYFNIVYVNDYYVGLVDKDGSAILLASKNSYQDNTFADGTPFGIRENF